MPSGKTFLSFLKLPADIITFIITRHSYPSLHKILSLQSKQACYFSLFYSNRLTMLRTIRLTLAIISLALITLLFMDFTGTLHTWLGWMARIQFLPALLALNVGVIVLLVALTWVFGRIYCSVICPLGILQDFLAWIGRQPKKRRKLPYSYSPAKSGLRYGVLVLFIVALVAGISSFAALLAPYSAYGRIANNLFQPLWMWGNNVLAHFAERAGSYAFYETEVWLKSLPTFIIALGTFIILAILAMRNGRTYCNTICPVGTVLGFISRYSLFRITIDKDKCTGCSLCSRRCKAACIDYKNHRVDLSRCVACMDCISQCKGNAIAYKLQLPWEKKDTKVSPAASAPASAHETQETRRSFLVGTALALSASALKAQEKKVDGGLAPIIDKKRPVRETPILPPGARNARHFAQHCTACQLCVSACPNQVLRPSTDLIKLMQPKMSYERGYCRPECTRCSEVCPTEAISLIDRAEKSSTKIGTAVWTRQNCITQTDGQPCDNCARHCPTEAILMIADSEHPGSDILMPTIKAERGIGCGAFEALCPARPYSAIHVEGIEAHHII